MFIAYKLNSVKKKRFDFYCMKKFLKYISVGIINTLTTYFISIILLEIFNLYLITSNLIGFLFGIFVSFCLNRNFVFKSKDKNIRKQVLKFICAFLISYLINLIFLIMCSYIFLINYYISQIIAMATYNLSFYYLSNKYIFNR